MSETAISPYMTFYKYLTVLNADEIKKLRKIAIGLLDVSAFTEEEIHELQRRLFVREGKHHNY